MAAELQYVGSVSTSIGDDFSRCNVDGDDDVAILADDAANEYRSIDISDESNPVVLDTIAAPGDIRFDSADRIDPAKDVFILAYLNGLDVIDYSNPSNLSLIRASADRSGGVELWTEKQVFFSSHRNSAEVRVWDYSDLSTLSVDHTFPMDEPSKMALNKELEILVVAERGVNGPETKVFDVSDLSNVTTLWTATSNPLGVDTAVTEIEADPVAGRDYFYIVSRQTNDIHIWEWDGSQIVQIATTPAGGQPTGLDYDASTQALIITHDANTHHVRLFDLSDPSNPTLLDESDGADDWESDGGPDVGPAWDCMFYAGGAKAVYADSLGDFVAVLNTGLNTPPAKPTCSVDSVDQREASLSSSAFSDPEGDPHDSSRWQVRDQGDADWSTPEYDSGWTATDLTTHTTDRVLTPGADYEARVAHRDPAGAFTWSDPVAFTTETLVPVEEIGPEGFFFGGAGRNDLLKFGQVHEDAGNPITGEMLHRAIAPRGAAGEALFRYVRVTITYATEFTATITPVLDGEELTSESVTFTRSAPSGQKTETIEVELARGSSFARRGLRGTWIRTLLELTETAGRAGYIAIDGIEYEWEPVRETTAALTFHQENLSVASLPTVTRFFFGAGNELGEFGAARDDLGTAVEAVLHSNPVAPAGSGGEAIFTNLYLALTRANPSDVPLNVTAIVDETSYSVGPVTLAGVANPKLEVLEIPLTRQITRDGSPVGRAHLRGSWCEIEMDTDGSLPDGDIIFETAELEHEVVQESEGDVGG